MGLGRAVRLSGERVGAGVIWRGRGVALLSASPARLLGLPGGSLEAGATADVTVIDPEHAWTVDPGQLLSRSKNTPFGGRAARGRAMLTIVGGNIVFAEEKRFG